MFSSKAWQCTKGKAGGNFLPRNWNNHSKMLRRTGKTFSLSLLLIAWAMLCAAALARDPDAFPADQPPPPPEPNPMTVEVPRGGPVLITLSAYSLTSPIIRFRIKRGAEAGKLGTPRMATASTAVVRYQPPAGAGPGDDSFYFAVQSAAGVSAPAEVLIKITDKDAVFVAPLALDFGKLLPGESARKTLTLENLGGGLAEGTVQVPDGWTVDGDADYKIGAGGKQSFTVVFKPAAVQTYSGDVTYTGNPERATDLNGEGVAPIAVTSGTVELADAGEGRMGTIHLENRTGAAQTLQVAAGPGLQTDGTVQVPAKGGADVLVQAAGQDEVSGVVTLTGDGLKLFAPVHAAGMQIATAPVISGTAKAAVAVRTAVAAGGAQLGAAGQAAPIAVAAAGDDAGGLLSLPPADSTGGQDAGLKLPQRPLDVEPSGDEGATISCDFKGAPPASYRVEGQSVGLDARGQIELTWTPVDNAPVVMNGDVATARLQNLRRGITYTVRMVGVDKQGAVVGVSAPGQIWTQAAAAEWPWEKIGIWACVAVGIGFGLWRMRRVQRL